MAYGAKYIATFSDIFQNTTQQYTAIIYKKDYVGNVYEITLGGTPLTIETDRNGESSYRPVIASTATLNLFFKGLSLRYWEDVPTNWDEYTGLWNEDAFDFDEFLTAQPDTFYIDVKKGTSLVWRGFYITTSDTYIDEIEPIEFVMKFSDMSLIKANSFGYNDAPPPAPEQLASVSFNARSSNGNFTFDASTSTGLAIDTTTGGLSRIKNAGVDPVSTRLTITLDCTNNLDLLDRAEFAAYVVNDSNVANIKYFQKYEINFLSPTTITLNWDFSLDQNDGIYFQLNIYNLLPPYTPTGTFSINTTSNVIANTIVDLNKTVIKYFAHEQVSINDLLVNCLMESGLNFNMRINSPFEMITIYGGTEILENTITNTYVLKNSLLKNINEYMSFYNILNGICNQFGLITYQKNGYLYVANYDELVNNESRTYKEYDKTTGLYVSDYVEEDTVIELNSSTFKNIGQSQTVRYSLPTKYIDLTNKIATASNQDNCYVKVSDVRYMGLVSGVPTYQTFITNWDLNGYANKYLEGNIQYRQAGLFPYATITSSPYNYRWGASSIYSIGTSQDDTKYLQTLNPVEVKQGDFVNVSFSYDFDARLGTIYRPQTKVAVVFKYPDPNNSGNQLTFYLNSTATGFTNTLTYLPLTSKSVHLKSLKMPRDGQVYLRFLLPWSSTVGSSESPTTASWMFIDYAMIQVFSGNASTASPGNVTYRTTGNNVNNNKDSLTMDSIFYLYDSFRYISDLQDTTTPLGLASISPTYRSYSISNLMMTEFYDPLSSDSIGQAISTTNSINTITKPIYYNTGLNNVIITGNYKSTLYPIGSKFRYTISGFTEKVFVLLDYMNDFKQGTQDVVLYSSQFIDPTAIDIETVLVTE
jgi:hypothetical protein